MADGGRKSPGDDVDVSPDGDISVIQAILAYRQEADDAKMDRMSQNRINREAYFGRQDWSHKQDGQSTEFLPKTATSIEQMCAFIKRGLMKFGDWYSVDLDRTLAQVISGGQVRAILNCFLNDLWQQNNMTTVLPMVISDAVKSGLLESLMILKVHGGMMPTRKYRFERGQPMTPEEGGPPETEHTLQMEETDEWKLRIDLVRAEDYYPDPTGRGLYEIHTVERDLDQVILMADEGIYDKAAVDLLIDTDFKRAEDEERSEKDRNQAETVTPSFRKRVVIDEFWGTLLNNDGTVAHRNCVATIANKKFLIRKPEPNPFWHQESPFCVAPIIRVPFSVWHKALYDDGSSLNLAINELFNLILDGGMAAVWGIRQLRLEDLEDPSQVEGGVKQGMTLAVKQTLPHNQKVMETVTTGDVPNDALAVYEATVREFNESVLTNELKVGNLPTKQVRATEVVEASQSQAVTLDGLVADMELWIQTILRKAWLTVLQNADELPQEIIPSVIDKTVAVLLMRASPEERYAMFAGKSQFRVFGLSGTMAKALDFQKFMAMQQAVMTNPLLFQEYQRKFSANKSLRYLMTRLNFNPDDLEKDIEELQPDAQNAEMERTIGAANVLGRGGQQGASAPGAGSGGTPVGGGSEVPAAINQLEGPSTGLPPTA